MDRRSFVRGVLGLGAAAAVVTLVPEQAEAVTLPVPPLAKADEAARAEADFRPEVDGAAEREKAQYYYYPRRRRRVIYRRRRFYRRRRVIYRRRRYYRRRYYW
jgi:hypothetical protein